MLLLHSVLQPTLSSNPTPCPPTYTLSFNLLCHPTYTLSSNLLCPPTYTLSSKLHSVLKPTLVALQSLFPRPSVHEGGEAYRTFWLPNQLFIINTSVYLPLLPVNTNIFFTDLLHIMWRLEEPVAIP